MAKKNPFVFTLGFNKNNPSHIRAVEILNETENKAQLIACAIQLQRNFGRDQKNSDLLYTAKDDSIEIQIAIYKTEKPIF